MNACPSVMALIHVYVYTGEGERKAGEKYLKLSYTMCSTSGEIPLPVFTFTYLHIIC